MSWSRDCLEAFFERLALSRGFLKSLVLSWSWTICLGLVLVLDQMSWPRLGLEPIVLASSRSWSKCLGPALSSLSVSLNTNTKFKFYHLSYRNSLKIQTDIITCMYSNFYVKHSVPKVISHLFQKVTDTHCYSTTTTDGLNLFTFSCSSNISKFTMKYTGPAISNSIPYAIRIHNALDHF
jgi:hypothetical protein